jgi:hypothetical protein
MHVAAAGNSPVAGDAHGSKRGIEALSRSLSKIFLLLSLLMFTGGGIAPARDRAASNAARMSPAAASTRMAGDKAQARRRRRKTRRTRQRGQRMSQPKDNSPSRDAGQTGDAGEQKKVDKADDAGKKQPPAPRPRRRYDPVLQPPEKTRTP